MNQALALLLAYKYAILFPLAVVEGPIVTIIAGFLVTLGLLNPFLVYTIVVLGDLAGDALFYCLGRWGSKIFDRRGSHFGITKEKLEQADKYFKNNHKKAIVLSKLVHGIGIAGLVAAGTLKVSYSRYFKTCFFVSIAQSALFLLIGILFGHAYLQIWKYLNYFAAVVSVAVLVAALFIFYKRADFLKLKNEK